jgi:glucosylceramidase
MSGNEQRDFVKYHLGPKFEDNGINTKIVIFDHNWDGTNDDGSSQTGAFEFIQDVYDDLLAVSYIDGTAFHGYGNGDATFQSDIYNMDPTKSIYFTERTNSLLWESWDGVLGHISKYYFIYVLNHWSRNVLLWNLALDLNNGPYNGGCENCTGLVTVDNSYLQYEIDYYITGHFSKFVDTGAVRLGTDEDVDDIDVVTFRNPDGSHVMVAVNTGYESKSFFVIWNDMSFYYNLPGQGLVTFKW